MRKGFTILELLVASLLLGMLMVILTMIFNQSSIAWRTGLAGVADLDSVRNDVASIRYEADSAYPDINGELKCVQSVFDENGKVRSDRLVNDFKNDSGKVATGSISGTDFKKSYKSGVGCGSSQDGVSSPKNYVVNVMSCGPDRDDKTRYDNIYSLPDDPSDW